MATYSLSEVTEDQPKKRTYSLSEVTQPDVPITDETANEYAKGLGAGALRGAADIGNTIINAATFIPRKLSPELERMNAERQASLQDWTTANQELPLFTTGRIAGNIAGTAGVGGAAGGIMKGLSTTPRAAALADAIATGGMGQGAMLNKVIGGAASGALGSLLIDPESAGYGAAVGGAIPIAGAAAPYVGAGIANVVGGTRTGTGGLPIKAAAKAGLQGGKAQKQVIENMRGQVPLTDVVDVAEQKLSQLGQEASRNYRSGMVDISNDKSVLEFSGIDKSLDDALNKVTFKGQIKNSRAAKAYEDIANTVNEWKSLDPAEFHTPEGLDALKQKIGGIVESIPFEEKTARMVGNNVYHAVKDEINKQAPTYSKIMKEYSEGMNEINEIRKTLSVGGKATQDTKLRKLQSIMRNNVNTNFGQREQLVKQLERESGDIGNAVAGQSLNDWIPKGLAKYVSTPTSLLGYGFGGIPLATAALLSSSPRLAGEIALKVGQGARFMRDASGKLVPVTGGLLGRD